VTTINVNTVAPAGSVLTVGDSGDTIVAVDEIKVNTVKDAGGNTLWVSNGSGTLSSVSGFGGALNLLSTQTASGSASISFTSGIDSTYKEYVFKFYNINPATDSATFDFNMSADSGSNYNVTKTTTWFKTEQQETGGGDLDYQAHMDLAQGTGVQPLTQGIGNGGDESAAGTLHLFNPASTTYVKNFYSRVNLYRDNNGSQTGFTSGYGNTTSAVDAVQFTMSSGNFDGTIKMYGVS